MVNFYLIRHAECENNLANYLIGGRSNHSPLTTKGAKQAELLGRRLTEERVNFDEIYSSTAVRARDTAKIVAGKIQFSEEKIILSESLLELDQGDWQGRKKSEIYTPEMLAIINPAQPHFKAPNGESQYEVGKRMLNCLEEIIANKNEQLNVAVFTHGIAIKCLLRELLNFHPDNVYKLPIDNTSITELVYYADCWQVERINDATHLKN